MMARRRRTVAGLDQLIVDLNASGAPVVVLAVALLLGLRHAADPDHLVAVSTLVATEPERRTRRAAALGGAWGLGHATTLIALGIPIVLFGRYLPDALQRAAEALVGVVIVLLAVQLLRRWRRGAYHAHAHAHGDVVHRHVHGHAGVGAHDHRHIVVRSPARAYGVGLVHGVGGSAGVGVLLLASIGDRAQALTALLVFALAAAVSMATLSSALGFALGRPFVERRIARLAPGLGAVSLVFGVWYVVGALAGPA
jgi:high-affinity nickel permease